MHACTCIVFSGACVIYKIWYACLCVYTHCKFFKSKEEICATCWLQCLWNACRTSQPHQRLRYVHVCIYMCTCECGYGFYECVHVCMYIHIHIYMHMHTHTVWLRLKVPVAMYVSIYKLPLIADVAIVALFGIWDSIIVYIGDVVFPDDDKTFFTDCSSTSYFK